MIEFKEGVSTPENWFRQAWQMFEASKSLYEVFSVREMNTSEKDNYRHVGAMKGAMLLLGLAAENALKGALIYKHKPDTSNDRLYPNHFHKNAHDLTDVADKLHLELSEPQLELLGRLTIFVQWASKYHVPLKKSELERASGKIKLVYPSDYADVENLILRLQIESGYDETYGWPQKKS
ncbi:hypothetical protein CCZ37_17405 [Vibrio qinghaiensis]|uniref:HEPN domain-containing protein n=1 Tax=Vibrio qinghaiensis TaxID=2025808 RepID=A0A223N314_9VIBR|nr:hypothetical protein [Vibrio qinghaiensis]ASU24234.1 hypothetical protein CCZ37_17405 [Vibrio qinghaiensis]